MSNINEKKLSERGKREKNYQTKITKITEFTREIKGNNKGRSSSGKELWQTNTHNEYKWKKIIFAWKFKI